MQLVENRNKKLISDYNQTISEYDLVSRKLQQYYDDAYKDGKNPYTEALPKEMRVNQNRLVYLSKELGRLDKLKQKEYWKARSEVAKKYEKELREVGLWDSYEN